MEINEILNNLLNPWTVFLLIIFLFLRKEAKMFMVSLNEYFSGISELKINIKDFEVSSKRQKQILKNISTMEPKDAVEIVGESISDNLFNTSKKLIIDNMSKNDLKTFLFLFETEDVVILKDDILYNLALLRLEDLGIIQKASSFKTGFTSKRNQSSWSVTPLGKIVRKLYIEALADEKYFQSSRLKN